MPWADTPFQLLSTPGPNIGVSPETLHVATDMSLAHNIFIRNLNAIYQQALGVQALTTTEKADFLTFIRAWLLNIHHHHSAEERYFFPRIAAYTGQPDIMARNLAQHHAFQEGVELLQSYCDKEWTGETYDGKKLREIIDGFGPVLRLHLAQEIETLIDLERFGGKKLAEEYKLLEERVIAEIPDKEKNLVFPSGLGGHDRTYEGGKNKDFPPLPFFVPYLVDWWMSRKYKGAWRFSPCTVYGIPRPLKFVSPAEDAS